ncbi:FAD binding domain-containing protein [Geomonas azotofigens]|uniref:FAD binding domain-containing protein n=1 Tax=Geomonas azotofigens TaxID=2843196 RepID=UPI001C116505|nr:FAD binding domain-containing protein [Geomonas azotofigens]MBU5613841.1 FAD binding domain-containing protein [Geomonas azotofigens]
MRNFEHLQATSIAGAVAALTRFGGKARLNAGGTDLFGLLKDQYLPGFPDSIINIKGIQGLDAIGEERGTVTVGALAKLSELSRSHLLAERFPALVQAAGAVASPQIRNVATVGGNLCQDVRCAYYRYPSHVGGAIGCARKGNGPCLAVRGDNRYHAVLGGRKCYAVCPSDTAVALAALDASLVVAGPEGERRIGVAEFYTPLGNRLERGEMVVRIEIPTSSLPHQRFAKFALRRPIDFAIVSVAVAASVTDGVCTEARIALGAVAPGPVRAGEAESFLRGKRLTPEHATRAAELALSGAKPLSRNGYKVAIAKTLVKRALLGEAAGGAGEYADVGLDR